MSVSWARPADIGALLILEGPADIGAHFIPAAGDMPHTGWGKSCKILRADGCHAGAPKGRVARVFGVSL